MVPITIEEYVKLHLKNNKDESKEKLVERLKDAVKRKRSGAKCQICGEPIWAIGSAIAFEGCFTCITGEADDSEDYEIDVVL